MMSNGSLIERCNAVDVPADVREMLSALTDKGPALRPSHLALVSIAGDNHLAMALGVAGQMIAAARR